MHSPKMVFNEYLSLFYTFWEKNKKIHLRVFFLPCTFFSLSNSLSSRLPSWKMNATHLFLLYTSLTLILLVRDSSPARASGRGSKGKGSKFGSRMLTNIRHRNPASASYYDNKDVSVIISLSYS